jgi:hypothetical protein
MSQGEGVEDATTAADGEAKPAAAEGGEPKKGEEAKGP